LRCSVIIPTRLRPLALQQTLESLELQSFADFNVIVVCDGEDPETRRLSEQYPGAVELRWLFHAQNCGQGAARQTGVLAADGELLLFLDDDVTAVPDLVLLHVDGHKHETSRGGKLAVCGRIVERYSRPPHSRAELYLRQERERILCQVQQAFSSCDLTLGRHACFGLNSSISRDVLLQTGGFDSSVGSVHEDMELGSRLYDRGVRFVLEPAAVVYHHGTKDLTKERVRSLVYAGRSDAYRVAAKGQRMPQTKALTRIQHGRADRRIKERLAWEFPNIVKHLAEVFGRACDVFHHRLFLRLWLSFTFSAYYWEGVKAAGVSLDQLEQLVGSPFPVFMFHSISAPGNGLERRHCLSPQRFARFMDWLRAAGYHSIPPDDCLSAAPRACQALFSFDDAYEDFYTEVFPHLDQWALTPLVFVVAKRIGETSCWERGTGLPEKRLLSASQIREMARHGVRFGSHSSTHPWLPDLSDAELQREICESKQCLEDLLGASVTWFAYPSGGVDGRVRNAVAQAGYKRAVTTEEGLSFWDDPLLMRRIAISESDALVDLALKGLTGHSIKQQVFRQTRVLIHAGLGRLPNPIVRVLRQVVRHVCSVHSVNP